jgi:hypothetical protein
VGFPPIPVFTGDLQDLDIDRDPLVEKVVAAFTAIQPEDVKAVAWGFDQAEGEKELARVHREALKRSNGTQSADAATVARLGDEYRISPERATAILNAVWGKWLEEKLAQAHREALNRSNGAYSADLAVVHELCRQGGISPTRAATVLNDAWVQWQKDRNR